MPYGNVKVYFDGSHYIGIPHTERPQRPRIKKREKEILLNEKSEVIPEYKEIAKRVRDGERERKSSSEERAGRRSDSYSFLKNTILS